MKPATKAKKLYRALKSVAEKNGGKILSTHWMGYHALHKFAYADGREFEITPGQLANIKGGWPSCIDKYLNNSEERKKHVRRTSKTRLSADEYYKELCALAASHGGSVVTKEWLGSKTKHQFMTNDGKEFSCTPDRLSAGGWPSKSLYDYYKKLCDFATSHGGSVVTKEWLGADTKHKFRTSDGIDFERRPSYLYIYGWPCDPGKNRYYEALELVAEENGGRVITQRWLGSDVIHKFQHADGGAFETTPHQLANKGWPRNLEKYLARSKAQKELKRTQEKSPYNALRHFAALYGGMLLTKEWMGNRKRHKFLSSEGVEFERSPTWLYKNGWPISKKAMRYKELEDIAKKNGGRVVSTQWLGSQTPHEFESADGRRFMMSPRQLVRYKGGWPRDIDRLFKHSAAHKKTDQQKMAEIKAIAERHGGSLISTKWIYGNTPLTFAFSDGQEFTMRPSALLMNGWPADQDTFLKMSMNQRLTPEERFKKLCAFAQSNGGELLTDKWLGTKTKHKFRNGDGKEFERSPAYLYAKGWPNVTSRMKRQLQLMDEMIQIAEANSGRLLSKAWFGINAKHQFASCGGEVFETSLRTLRRSGWPKKKLPKGKRQASP